LGLPLAKALAEIQGGVLSVASTLGEGFAATLELPEG
jgi:signal transduction histidine kinase